MLCSYRTCGPPVDAYILVKEHASDVDGFLASMWGVITPVVARARLRVQLALQDHPCLYRLVSKRRLHPQAAKSINMRLHANFHRGDVDLGTSQHIGHVPGSASAVRPPVHASVMHAGEGGGAGVSAAGDAAGSSAMPSPILVAPAPSADKHSGPRPALHTAVMTFAGDPAGRPVLGAVYLPPRSRELATPLRIMAQNKLARCTSEHHERITRVDVRKVRVLWVTRSAETLTCLTPWRCYRRSAFTLTRLPLTKLWPHLAKSRYVGAPMADGVRRQPCECLTLVISRMRRRRSRGGSPTEQGPSTRNWCTRTGV